MMRILELYAEEFGCLSDRRFTFSDGLVIVEGENESGKSTLQALFRFLFYGFPRRAGADAEERDKRLSHKGRRAAGAIRFLHSGEEYLLRRQLILRGGKRELVSEELSVTKISDGSAVELGDRSAGEYFLGMPWELYQSSFCARQTELDGVIASDTGGALGDFLFRGDESARIDKAAELLVRARRELQYQRGRGGRIAELEDELGAVKSSLADAYRDTVALREKREAMLKYEKMKENLARDVEALDQKLQSARADEMIARFDAWHAARREEEEAKRLLQEANAAFDRAGVDEQFLAAAREDIDVCERARSLYAVRADEVARTERSLDTLPAIDAADAIKAADGAVGIKTRLAVLARRARGLLWCGVILAILAALSAVAALLVTPILFAVGALLLCGAIGCLVGTAMARQKKKAFLLTFGVGEEAALEVVLDRYERGNEAGAALLRELGDRRASADEAIATCLAAERALLSHIEAAGFVRPDTYADAKRMIAELEAKRHNGMSLNAEKEHALARAAAKRQAYESGLDPTSEADWRARRASLPTADKDSAELSRELEFKRGAYESAANAYANAATDAAVMAASMTDPAILRQRECEIKEELESARFRYAAVTLAEEALLEAGKQVRESVVPFVAKRASEIFAQVVGEADRTLLIENDFSVKVMTAGDVYPLSHFSVGCRDAALLAIRLALAEAVSEEPLPFLFDEVTAHLDDKRAARFLHAFHAYCASGRQGVLFTCHGREAALLAGCEHTRVLL